MIWENVKIIQKAPGLRIIQRVYSKNEKSNKVFHIKNASLNTICAEEKEREKRPENFNINLHRQTDLKCKAV